MRVPALALVLVLASCGGPSAPAASDPGTPDVGSLPDEGVPAPDPGAPDDPAGPGDPDTPDASVPDLATPDPDPGDDPGQPVDPGANADPGAPDDPGLPGDAGLPPDPGATPDPGAPDDHGIQEDPGLPDDPGAIADPGPALDPGTDACAEPLPGKPLALLSPAAGDRFLAGNPVMFAGTTACADATVSFLADGKYPLGSASAAGGTFELSYAFNTPGPERRVLVSVAGACGCEGSVEVAFAVQPAASFVVEDRKDGNGNAFTVRRAYFPTADPGMDLAVVGSSSAKTVKSHAESALSAGADSAVNGGYFGAGTGPVSYAKGHLGHENQTGNVKGPRACLAWNRTTREARVEVSMGREYLGSNAWGGSLFPSDSDVICAGPRLLEAGQDVFAAHYVSEHFETSGINPDAAYPRTAACVTADGGVLIVAAQSSSSKSRGFTIPELATWLKGLGCVDALNLDGGGSTASWNAGPPVTYEPGTEDRAVYNAVVLLRP